MTTLWILILIFILLGYLKFNPQFGESLNNRYRSQYQRSKFWKGGKFHNLSPTSTGVNILSIPKIIKAQLTDRHLRQPKAPIPVLPIDKAQLTSEVDDPKFIWFGHSVLLLRINGKHILIDPMFGSDASPVGPVRTKRFSKNTMDIIDQLPKIDVVLLTHDHYDHLDYESILKLRTKVSSYITSLGVARHLHRWGISNNQITEMDWWEEIDLEGIKITFTPSRHFSGRGLFDRFGGLWGGFVFQTAAHQIYWSGDGGYGEHFKRIGEKFGAFDWAFMECGQYNENWAQLHLFPEEAIQAAMDVHAKVAIPVHWGGFALAMHTWDDPVERFVKEAELKEIDVCTPRMGDLVVLGKELKHSFWWR